MLTPTPLQKLSNDFACAQVLDILDHTCHIKRQITAGDECVDSRRLASLLPRARQPESPTKIVSGTVPAQFFPSLPLAPSCADFMLSLYQLHSGMCPPTIACKVAVFPISALIHPLPTHRLRCMTLLAQYELNFTSPQCCVLLADSE